VGTPVTVNVTASDPDGQPISSLSANLSGLPAGHNAVFNAGAGNTSGTLTWTPAAGMTGSFQVRFIAANALIDSVATSIAVTADRKPVVNAPANVSGAEGAPITVNVTASDPDGHPISSLTANLSGLPAGHNAVFTAGAGHTSGTLTWTPAAGMAGTYPVRFIASNALTDSATTTVVVSTGGGPNLVGNPSFESSTSGWAAYNSSIARVSGGQEGSFAVRVTGPASTATFGINDSPNWVGNTGVVGKRYRFTAWVRSVSNVGLVRLRVREYLGGTQYGSTTYSPAVALSSAWQTLTVDYVTTRANSTLDFNILDSPVANGEVFLVDNISIVLVSGSGIMALSPDVAQGSTPLGFSAAVFPNPVHAEGTLRFVTSKSGPVRVQLYDTHGRLARTLLDEPDLPAGFHDLSLGSAGAADRLPAGLYFYRLKAVEGVRTGRFILMK
jgi:hypothetical protein